MYSMYIPPTLPTLKKKIASYAIVRKSSHQTTEAYIPPPPRIILLLLSYITYMGCGWSHYTPTAGAASQYYWDSLMLLKCELMLLKCQINTITNKNKNILLTTKCLERVLKYWYSVSIIFNYLFPKTMFATCLYWSGF